MEKRNHIIKEGGSFLSANATPEEIEEAGRKIICLIYDEKNINYNLNDLRLKKFEQNVIKSVKCVTAQNFHQLIVQQNITHSGSITKFKCS